MHTFAPETKSTQPATLARSPLLDRAQYARIPVFEHNFGRIPVYATTPVRILPKLAVNAPGNLFEQEADRVADQVMRMSVLQPQPQLQRAGYSATSHQEGNSGLQALSGDSAGNAQTIGYPLLRSVLSSPGQPLDAATRNFMEPRFGQDFSGVRVHTGGQAAESARAVQARAYTVGRDVVFGEGNYAPGTDEGKKLMAHELVHTVQQSGITGGFQLNSNAVASLVADGKGKTGSVAEAGLARPAAGPITSQAPTLARAPEDSGSDVQDKQATDKPYMGYTPDLGGVENQPVEARDAVGMVDVPITSLFAPKAPHAPIATVTKGTTLKVKGIIQPADSSKQPVYVVLYHGRMENKQSAQVELLIPLADLAVSSQGPAQAQQTAAQTSNDWMAVVPEKGQAGNAETLKPVLKAIREARAAIEERKLSYVSKKKPDRPREGYRSADDDRTKDYDTWLRNKNTHPRLARSADDIRWNVLRRFFSAEGRPSEMMTYDRTNITWGPGFAGMGSTGITEQAMARLFNQSPEAKDAFWKVGITVVGVDLVMVNIKDAEQGEGEKLHGTAAENVLRLDKKLISVFINISQGLTEPGQVTPSQDLRQKVLDAHFETFLNTTLRGSAGIIDGMDEMAAAVAAHAVHTGQHSWGQFQGAKVQSDVEGRIRTKIESLEKEKAAGKPIGFIWPLEHIKRNLDQKFID